MSFLVGTNLYKNVVAKIGMEEREQFMAFVCAL